MCVLNKVNIKTIPQYLNFVSTLNISDIRFIPFMPVGRGMQYRDEMIPPEEFYKVLKSKKELFMNSREGFEKLINRNVYILLIS